MPHPDTSILQRLADGLLATDDDAAVRAHLSECEPCRERADRERLLSEALRDQDLERPSASFDRRVLDAVLPARVAQTRETPSLRRYAGLLALCGLTLVVVLLSPVEDESKTASWLQSAMEWISSATTRVADSFSTAVRQIPAPSHTITSSGSDVMEVLCLALLALGAFAALDHFLGPRLRRDR